jgi:hypothetical protein
MAQAVFRQKGPSFNLWESKPILLSIKAKQSSRTAKLGPLAAVSLNRNTTGDSYMWQAGSPVLATTLLLPPRFGQV